MKNEENKAKSRYAKEFKDSILKLADQSQEPLVKIANKEKSFQIQRDEIQELTLMEETKQLKNNSL